MTHAHPLPSAALVEPLATHLLSADDSGLTRAQRCERTAQLLAAAHAAEEAQDAQSADALRSRVVLLNRGAAEAIARRYRRRGVPEEDLNQVAYEALTQAVFRFDPARGTDLLSFAVPTIRGALQRYFRDLGWSVRPPRHIQEIQSAAPAAVDRLEQDLGRTPSERETADALGITTAEYREAMSATGCFRPVSLDVPVGSESASLGDLLHFDDPAQPASEARVILTPVIRRLSDRDRRILYLRYFEDLTQAEIGRQFGVTQVQISRLLTRILGDLRHDLGAGPDSEWAGADGEQRTTTGGSIRRGQR